MIKIKNKLSIMVVLGVFCFGVQGWASGKDKAKLETVIQDGHSSWVYSVAYSPDGEFIVSGSRDKTIKIWRASDDALVRTLKGHSGQVNSVAYSPDGKFIVSGSDDTTMRVWNIKTGESISLVVFDTGDWFVYDNKGHFDCSAGGRKYIKFVKGFSVYEPDQFWNEFFTPGLFARFIGGEKLKDIKDNKKL